MLSNIVLYSRINLDHLKNKRALNEKIFINSSIEHNSNKLRFTNCSINHS